MNESMDRALADWLREGPEHGPREGLERALAATRRTSQRPGWTFPERWLPMQLTMQRLPTMRPLVYLALVALLVVALAAAALIASQRRLPAPFGPAGNGLIAYDAGGSIYVAQSDGSGPRQIDGGLGYDLSPTFSRDGTRIAFWSSPTSASTDTRLFVADVDGPSPAREIGGDFIQTGRLDVAPAWSPDGRRIYFSGQQRTGELPRQGGLVVAATDGSEASIVGDARPRGAVHVSPDGQWIAFREDDGPDAVLTVLRPDGTDERRLATAPADSDAFMSIWWSADGTRLVVHRDDVVETVDLGGTVTRISRPNERASYPSWSPDGTLIAYLSTAGAADQIVVANDDGTGHRDLGPIGGCMMGWSPDSTYLFGFTSECFSSKLTRIPVDDPAAAIRLDLPGDVAGQVSWQRTAP